MANRNRTEVAAAIEALAAVVDLEELKEAMNDFFAQSCVFRKDVSTSDTASGTKTLDFTDIDYIAITQSASTTYTLSGVQQGEVKYLKITKTATHLIAFTGATDTSKGKDYINTDVTVIIYKITNKDGTVYIDTISLDQDSIPITDKKIVDITSWDVTAAATIDIAHGIAGTGSGKRIRRVSVFIRNDDDDLYIDLISQGGTITTYDSTGTLADTDIRIDRGTFSPSPVDDWNQTSYIRGYVEIEYTNDLH